MWLCNGKLMRVHDSIKPPVWSPASSQICLNPAWLGGCGLRPRYAQPRPREGSREGPHSPTAKLDSVDKFRNPAADLTCWRDWIMKCDGAHTIIIHSFRTHVVHVSLRYFLCNIAYSSGKPLWFWPCRLHMEWPFVVKFFSSIRKVFLIINLEALRQSILQNLISLNQR